MGSIGSSLLAARDTVADLAAQLKKSDSSKVQTFQAYAQDVSMEKIADARYIGDLRPNQNRMNVFSMASTNDPEDYYRFNLNFGGNIHLSMLADRLDVNRNVVQSETAKGLGIQVIQFRGLSHRVIADSNPNSGAAHEIYNQLTAGDGARLAAGKYVVRVYREQETSPNTEFFYSLQLVGDRYHQDYDTIDREAPAHPPTKSKFELMTADPAVTLLALNMDATLSVTMLAASRPTRLSTTSPDNGMAPVTQLLDAFM